MGLFLANGTRVTKATFPATAVGVTDPLVKLTANVFRTRRVSETDSADGSLRTVFKRAGAELRQSEVDRLFLPATIDSVTPASGPIAGGTVVTIRGTNLDGASGVTIGVAATALTVVSPSELRVTTAATTAGAKDVVLADDGGNVTRTGGFTYV